MTNDERTATLALIDVVEQLVPWEPDYFPLYQRLGLIRDLLRDEEEDPL